MASALREAVALRMRLRGFSPRTHDSYIYAMKELARFYMRPLDTLVCVEVQAFLDHLITVRKLAWATINVYFSAYRFLYEQVLDWPKKRFSIPRRGRSQTRPGVLSPEETRRLIDAPRNLKHRALLSMVYGSGLRVAEVVNVQPVHVDRGRMAGTFTAATSAAAKCRCTTPVRRVTAPPARPVPKRNGWTHALPSCCRCNTFMSCSPCRTH